MSDLEKALDIVDEINDRILDTKEWLASKNPDFYQRAIEKSIARQKHIIDVYQNEVKHYIRIMIQAQRIQDAKCVKSEAIKEELAYRHRYLSHIVEAQMGNGEKND